MYRPFWIFLMILSTSSMTGQTVRTFDGRFNNSQNPEWGSTQDLLVNITSSSFGDSISTLSGQNRLNPREISNYMFSQEEDISDPLSLSDYMWSFGQFVDHEIIEVASNPFDPMFIEVPADDNFFEPGSSMLMFRSKFVPGTGTSADNPRRYQNEVTSFIDGSSIYGSDENRAEWLRTLVDGKLKMSTGNLLPWNTTTGEFNDIVDRTAPIMEDPTRSGQKLFVAGDKRANENPMLIAMHTLFVREHNRLCDVFKAEDSNMSDEELYQQARRHMGAYLQNIVYNEWLPSMGVVMPVYGGYRSEVSPQISNVFSAAAFRFGHTLINSDIIRMDEDGKEIGQGSISLRDAFFNPLSINLAGGIEPYLRGMATQIQQDLDPKIIDDLRNFLFGSSESGLMDLAAININRGRERGIPDFNTIRENVGLPLLKSFSEFTTRQEEAEALEHMFGSVDDIDAWVGMLSEKHMPDALLGNTLMLIIERQFQNIRDGDRFYFENDPAFSDDEVEQVLNTRFRDIIMRNSDIVTMQENVFIALDPERLAAGPELLEVSLEAAVFPNPTPGSFTIKIYEDESSDITIRMFDSLGKEVYSGAFSLSEGNNYIDVDMPSTCNAGFYNVLIEKAPVEYRVLRVIKQ